jgi:hypothetical protein
MAVCSVHGLILLLCAGHKSSACSQKEVIFVSNVYKLLFSLKRFGAAKKTCSTSNIKTGSEWSVYQVFQMDKISEMNKSNGAKY